MSDGLNEADLRRMEERGDGTDVPRLIAEIRRMHEECALARLREREACATIAEGQLGAMYHAHGPTGDQVIGAIISGIRERGQPE